MPKNVALNKIASQSSFSLWSEAGESARAINGKKTGGFGFHTDLDDTPWWQVDLGQVFSLTCVVVYNRESAGTVHGERAKSMAVLISVNGENWEEIHSGGQSFGGISDGNPFVQYCFGKRARFVRLRLNERTYFHLDEVEVYADDFPFLNYSLAALGSKYGTDKVSHGFCDIYENMFFSMRSRVTNVLEIGVFFGASLRMWRDWFPHATIHGADHFTGHQGNGFIFANSDVFLREVEAGEHPRIVLHTLDQSSRENTDQFSTNFRHGTFDLVIDDASHLMRDQQQTLASLFCLVKPGGYFVIEDMHSSVDAGYDLDEDGSNSTLLMIEKALSGQGWQSKYMSRQDMDFLDQNVDPSYPRVYGRPGSLTCVLRRRASSRATEFPATSPGSVAVIDYATADGYNQSRQRSHIVWAQEWVGQSEIKADVVCFGPDTLDDDFRERNSAILSRRRGGGYWLWKPYIIASMLATTNAEFIVYCDSGSIIRQSLTQAIAELRSTGAAVLAFEISSTPEQPCIEYMWTKGQVLRAMDATDTAISATPQIGATASVWRVCDASRQIVAEWLRLMQDPIFSTDVPSSDGDELPIFVAHRRDQSVLSVLLKKIMLSSDANSPLVIQRDYMTWVGQQVISSSIDGSDHFDVPTKAISLLRNYVST